MRILHQTPEAALAYIREQQTKHPDTLALWEAFSQYSLEEKIATQKKVVADLSKKLTEQSPSSNAKQYETIVALQEEKRKANARLNILLGREKYPTRPTDIKQLLRFETILSVQFDGTMLYVYTNMIYAPCADTWYKLGMYEIAFDAYAITHTITALYSGHRLQEMGHPYEHAQKSCMLRSILWTTIKTGGITTVIQVMLGVLHDANQILRSASNDWEITNHPTPLTL